MKKRMSTVVLIAVLVLSMVMVVSAENCGDHNNGYCIRIENRLITQYAWEPITNYAQKHTSDPLFFFFEGGNLDAAAISVWGSPLPSGIGENLTYKNGQQAEYVACQNGTQYLIRSLVYEENLSWCLLKGYPPVFSGTVSGCWYPECYDFDSVVEPYY